MATPNATFRLPTVLGVACSERPFYTRDMLIDLLKLRTEVLRAMEAQDLSFRDLAEALGSSHATSSLHRTLSENEGKPGLELAAALAKFLGKSLRDFETWHEQPRTPWAPAFDAFQSMTRALEGTRLSGEERKALISLVREMDRGHRLRS